MPLDGKKCKCDLCPGKSSMIRAGLGRNRAMKHCNNQAKQDRKLLLVCVSLCFMVFLHYEGLVSRRLFTQFLLNYLSKKLIPVTFEC